MSEWIENRPFVPEVGKRYQISFGEITYNGTKGVWGATIRVQTASQEGWIDEDTNEPLDPTIAVYPIKGFIELF
jgi:hypothetical protein